MSGHTPGPWTLRFGLNVMGKDVRYPKQERLVANAGGHTNNVWNAEVTAENEANAHLIAAAPELLEGLLHVRHSNHGYYPSACSACAAAEAAVAKAEGR